MRPNGKPMTIAKIVDGMRSQARNHLSIAVGNSVQPMTNDIPIVAPMAPVKRCFCLSLSCIYVKSAELRFC